MVGAVVAALLASTLPVAAVAPATAAPVGQGFNLNASDLRFILKQIKISEQHAATLTAANPCGTLLGSGVDQIPAGGVGVTLPWGLRTVDGSCNNIELATQNTFGTADQVFPRLVPKQLRPAETGDPDGPGPAAPVATSYTQTSGVVFDSQPRLVSNLIVDQTATNPAAVVAAGETPVLTPSGAFFIQNVAPDVGLSAPYNSWFTLFGQFFDHGLDLVSKGGRGTVLIPLQPDDPQYVANSPTNFMALSRATHSGNHEAVNQTSPFVDQSQTYTSHPSHQVFLREYETATGGPVATGELIEGPGGGMATWDEVQAQSAALLGITLSDADVLNLPLLRTDPYGRFLRGPNGYPQIVLAGGGLREGNPAAPVNTAGATPSGHAFLDDIAHHAAPGTWDHDNNPATAQVPQTADGLAGTDDDNLPGTYDDEMLGAHFIAGDGRVNENIGLTAVHHVFHSEHNRLVAEIDGMLHDPALGFTAAEVADWETTARPAGWNYGERLFQAARFVTEMEYQHLAFEEFIRKVQPMVNPFGEGGTGYHTTINPAIKAEFAHAVYRFGHSMLTESVDRVRANGTRDDIALLDAFLNPPSFMAGGRTPQQAAGDIVRGMTRQTGNELDEFVTEALRNELLGLPLDLATLNMARARETGVPTLNEARRAFYAESDNPALVPYLSWADLSFSLKHTESLPNFVAAYGTHPSITGDMATRRAAAYALVYGVNGPDGEPTTADDIPAADVPEDSYAFLNSAPHETVDPVTGEPVVVHNTWTLPDSGVTTTGVDRIDLWVGGLAEKQMVFGGLLGPTFNYVFEGQTEALQDGDRFYYLSRTAGLNLLTQLEGNSFAELIQRNTDVEGLPADSFSRPDLVFNLAALGTTGAILDDPATDYNESTLLVREANGTIRYGGPAHAVFNGTAGNNLVRSSEGDDTIRGNDGNDRMEGGDGVDNLIGGLGDDILTDLNGDDVLKGGDGNDTLSSGQGAGGDLNQGGRGDDLIIGGNDMTESFAGPGDDLVFAGDGEDTVFGDDGDDWIEGGLGPFNLLQGDNGAPFQDDPNEPGHDVIVGYGGEQDYDSEGGDDIMLMGPGIQRAEGMLGFDFTTHKLDPVAADSDMSFSALAPPSVETNRDRFDLVESLSGWDKNDILRGDDRVDTDMVGHELTAAGVARVAGLSSILPAPGTSFTGGNILLGGAGSDLIEGRGGNDLIDGDAWLDVQLSAPTAITTDPADTRQVHEGLSTLRADVLAGRVNPGTVDIVRTLRTTTSTGTDIALFTGARADYTVTTTAAGVTTVVDNVGTDGTDTLRNVEQLRFSDTTIATPGPVTVPAAPVIGTVTAGNASATVAFSTPATGGSAITAFQVEVQSGGAVLRTVQVTAPATSTTVTGLTNGTAYQFRVRAVNAVGQGAFSALSAAVIPATVPAAPVIGNATPGNTTATVRWTAPNNGGRALTSYQVEVRTGTTILRTVTVTAPATSTVITALTNGTPYRFRVRAINGVGTGAYSALSNIVTPAVVPAAPVIGTATPANASATVRWTAPGNGGSPLTSYQVEVRTGTTIVRTVTVTAPATSSVITALTNGTPYRFRVRAVNAIGTGPYSALSNIVTPVTVPGAPIIRTAVSGVAGGAITATAAWDAPANTGGTPITGYRVRALRMAANGTVLATTVSAIRPATSRSFAMTLPVTGNYRFTVQAVNAVGDGAQSARSNQVIGR